MKMSNEALKIVTPEDAEETRSMFPRLAGLHPGEELDPARLMDLLGDIDGIKREIHERMRRIDAVKEAKSLLMDESAKTEMLNKRLAEMSKLMHLADSGSPAADGPREVSALADARVPAGRIAGEGVAIAWPKSEDSQEVALSSSESSAQINFTSKPASKAPSNSQSREQKAAQKHQPGQDSMVDSAAPHSMPNGQQLSGPETTPAVKLPPSKDSNAGGPATNAQIADSGEFIAQGEQSLEAVRALLAEVQALYRDASEKKEMAAAEFQAVEQEIKLAHEGARHRLENAEALHSEAAQKSASTKSKVDKAEFALTEARVREEAAATDLQSARQELTTAYQFASVAGQRRFESSEFFERTARWAVFASLFSWVATVWMGWIALLGFHKNTSILLPILGSIILVSGGMVLIKRRIRNSEDR